MAAKDLDSVDIKPLEDITTCCICTEVFTDPIVLPCIHTFCRKCLQETGLKTKKGPGDEMLCPICRRMFKIPPEGFHGLPKNFFVERLIQVANLSDQSESPIPLCDACVEENEEAGKEVSAADTYCVDCNQKFCQECCRHHRKFKLTKHHRLIPMTEHETCQTNLAPSVCELHEQKVLDVYCADCKTVVCAICFIDDHDNHKGSHVSKFVGEFRKQMESNAEAINECRSKAEMKKADLLKVKEDIQEKVENLESDFENRKDELKRFADKHTTSLLQVLYAIRQGKLKEIQMATDDIDAYLSSLETYNPYCEKIMAKGSASDICRAFSDLSVRAVELQEQCQLMIERETQSFNFCFQISDLEEFLQENCGNLIGEFEEEGDPKSKRRIKESLLSQQSNEIDRLRKEIKSEIADRESLRFEIVQLRIDMNKEVQSNKTLTEELCKEIDNKADTKKLGHKLRNSRITITILEAKNRRLKQELDVKIMTNNSLQSNNDKLKEELYKEKIANKSLQAENDELKQELEEEKMSNNYAQGSNSRLVQDVNTVYKMTTRALEDHVQKLKHKTEAMKTVGLPYKWDPVLIQTITTKAAEEKQKTINGLAILDNELFVVSQSFSEVEVHDLMRLTLNRRWNLKELISPLEIGSCNRYKCLYIFDHKGFGQSKEILRVDPNGNLIKNWSTGDAWGCGLSVAHDSNIILTLYNKHKLNEYSPIGQLIREIDLSSGAGICHPWHAIKLTNGHFMVGLGRYSDDLHSVCIVDGDGKLVKSVQVGGKREIVRPFYLSVDGTGSVMVADLGNSRVLLFDSDLQFQREILSEEKHGLRRPWKILLDELNGRLLVADNEEHTKGILIFELK